jgi:hypothetical protein
MLAFRGSLTMQQSEDFFFEEFDCFVLDFIPYKDKIKILPRPPVPQNL